MYQSVSKSIRSYLCKLAGALSVAAMVLSAGVGHTAGKPSKPPAIPIDCVIGPDGPGAEPPPDAQPEATKSATGRNARIGSSCWAVPLVAAPRPEHHHAAGRIQ